MDLLNQSSPGGLPTLSLANNSSWLPWEGCHASHQPSDASTPLRDKTVQWKTGLEGELETKVMFGCCMENSVEK